MDAIEYIKEQLGNLAVKFPYIRIKYAYNNTINSHVVELTPEHQYYHNDFLDNEWIPISLDFKSKFTTEDITFISSDSSLRIDKPELEWNAEFEFLDFTLYNNLISHYSVNNYDVEFPAFIEFYDAFANSSCNIQSIHTYISALKIENSALITFKEQMARSTEERPTISTTDEEFALAA